MNQTFTSFTIDQMHTISTRLWTPCVVQGTAFAIIDPASHSDFRHGEKIEQSAAYLKPLPWHFS